MKKRKPIPREQPRIDYSWLLISAAVLIAYVPALNGSLLWDDLSHITLPELRSAHGLWRIWTELGATQQYYPLLHSAFWIQHRVWGDAMPGYHLANIAFHATAAYLVVLILRQLAIPGALLAGLIFALHPVSVESVAWISEQKNTLSAVFYLASALVYLRLSATGLKPCATVEPKPGATAGLKPGAAAGLKPGATEGPKPGAAAQLKPGATARLKPDATVELKPTATDGESWTAVAQPFRAVRYWLAFGLFICALLTKSVTATLPAALLVVVWWQRGRLEWRRDVRPLVPWFVIAAGAAVMTAWFEHHIIGARGEAFSLTVGERIVLAGRIIWFYLAKLAWPVNLMFTYPRWTIDAAQWSQYLYVISAVALAIGLTGMARRRRGPLAGYLFFCGTLIPALGFVNVYPFVFSYVADHFQYLASLGIIVPLAAGVAIASERFASPQRVLTIAGAAIVVILAALTWQRSAVYENTETLFRDTIARNPGAWMAYQNLGTELAAQNRLPEAIEAYEGALRARPNYPGARNNLVLAHMRLADALAEQPKQAREAIGHYEAVLRLDPNVFRAHYNLGTILMDMPGRHAEAVQHLEQALKIQPNSAEAHVNLGVALADEPSRTSEAIAHLERALAEKPDLPIRPLLDQLRRDSKMTRR